MHNQLMTTNNMPVYAAVTASLGFSLEDIINGRSIKDNMRIAPKVRPMTKRERQRARQHQNRVMRQATAENPIVVQA